MRAWWRNRGRAIFRFWDGERKRSIDPMVVYRRLNDHPRFDWDSDPKLFENIGDERPLIRQAAENAIQKCVEATRDAFEVRAFDGIGGGGLTEVETMSLFESFCGYMGVLKKNTDQPQTSQPSTDSRNPNGSHTKNSSDSGSISTGSQTAPHSA